MPASESGHEARLVRYETAARMLEVSVSTIKRLVRSEELPMVSIGGSSRIRVTDLDDYVARLGQDGEQAK